MHPVEELEGVFGVREVLVGQFFRFVLLFDPVKQLCSFFLVFGMSGLVTAGELCRVLFFSLRAASGSSPERKRAR